MQIVITYASQGSVTEYTVGSETYDANDKSTHSIIKWFYGLNLKECKQPEDVQGNEGYTFVVDGKTAFSYDYRESEGFVVVNDVWYEVKNPSAPSIEQR